MRIDRKLFSFLVVNVLIFEALADNKLEVGKNSLSIRVGDRIAALYKFQDVPFKPYIKELYTPAGLQILEDAPPDHLHHHGVMFAVAVNGVNFWEEKTGSSGVEAHLSFDNQNFHENFLFNDLEFTLGEFHETLDWKSPDGVVLVKEKRIVLCGSWIGRDANVLFWKTELRNPSNSDKVELTGHHYFGLGVRLLTTPMEKVQIFSDSEENLENVRGDEYLRTSPWCGLTLENDKGKFTVLLVDLKDSVRYPARWFTMRTPFVYVSATRNLWKEPLEIPPGQRVSFSTAIVVWDGIKTKEELEKVGMELSEFKMFSVEK